MNEEIWIVDKQSSFRNGLKVLLQKKYPLYRICEYATIEKLPDLKDRKPILLLIEPFLQITIQKNIKMFQHLNVPTAFITMEQRQDHLLFFIQMNILGYLKKDMETEHLLTVIDSLLYGERYLHPAFGRTLLDSLTGTTDE